MLLDFGNYVSERLQSLYSKNINEQEITKLVSDISRSLIYANVSPQLVIKFRESLKSNINIKQSSTNAKKIKDVQNAVIKVLIDLVDPKVAPYDIKSHLCSIVIFVGLQGAGKTTSICKYANYYKKKGEKVGIVCADTFRAGAFDQVKQNAEKINVSFYGSDSANAVQVAKEGVQKFKSLDYSLILVDTSGRHTQEDDLFDEMKLMVAEIKPHNIIFVMDAGIGQSAEDQAIGFKNAVSYGGIILTKLDGTNKTGGALSSLAAAKCPIEFIGTGEGMDEFEVFNPHKFISKLLGKGDLEGLFEKLSSLELDDSELSDKLMSGKMTMGDFYSCYKKIYSLGPLSSIMAMIPGAQNIPMPDERKIKEIGYVFDSMSNSELKSHGDLFYKEPSRVKRLCKGSGTSESRIGEILENYKMINNFMLKAGKMIPGFEGMMATNASPDQRATSEQMNALDGLLHQYNLPDINEIANHFNKTSGNLFSPNDDEEELL